jgi:uncharacterized heparinase superfamily protein
MSLIERIESGGEDQIEPGKRLIKAGDAAGGSLAERLARGLHLFAWRAPFHSLRLRGRHSLKLVAVPKDPVAGDKTAGEALLGGRMAFGRTSVPLASLSLADPALPAGFLDHVQSFAWLRDLAAAATRQLGAPIAEALVRGWLEVEAKQPSERLGRADLGARRILFWTAYAPYILSSRDQAYRAAVLNSLARAARQAERGAAKAPPGLARVTGWAGVVASALLLRGGPVPLKSAEAGLVRALGASLTEDGGLVSRSPEQQLALVELLGQLRAAYNAGQREMPEPVAEALSGAVSALLGVTLGDEALSSWQGCNMASARKVAAAVEGSGMRARALRQARGWGYQRLAAKNTVIVFDGAPPPTSRALSGGCASTLAFEMSEGKERLIVNCGGEGGASGMLPDALTRGLRTTAAHSTLTLGDRNSTAILDDGGLGKGVSEVELARDETGGVIDIEASHDGYVRRFGLLHRRQLTLAADGRELAGQDSLAQHGRKRRGEPVPFALRFHLAPSVEVAATADGRGALLRIKGRTVWQFRCRGGTLSIEDSLWVDGEARHHPTLQLVVTGESPPEGLTIAWSLTRAG